MRSAIADSIFLWLGIVVTISLVCILSFFGTKSHEMGNAQINQEAKQSEFRELAKAQPYVDIEREVTGDDLVEFITDNGGYYTYFIKFKDINTSSVTKELATNIVEISDGSPSYEIAKRDVLNNLGDNWLPGDAEIFANTAVWSQYFLSSKLFGNSLTSQFKPVILVNKSNTKYSDGSADWTNIKTYSSIGEPIYYSLADIVSGEYDFVIVYEEV